MNSPEASTSLEARLAFTLKSGAVGYVLTSASLRTILLSPEPFPPGATLRGSIAGVACPFEVKVRTCKRTPAGDEGGLWFTVEGRLQNATREMLDCMAVLQRRGASG